MSTNITEYLVELNESQSLVALRGAYNAKSIFIFKVDAQSVPVKATIESFNDKKSILHTDPNDIKIPLDKEFSIKFNVGTETYFLKTLFQRHMNRYFFDMACKVIQLKRRKEPRHLIPKKWPQTAAVVFGTKEFPAKISDISLSGIRLEVNAACPQLNRDETIKIKFQVYKRAEVSTEATVRFALYKPNMSPILGLEYSNIPEALKQRVEGIVSDIEIFYSTNKA